MTHGRKRNLPASIRQKLLNLARARNEDFQLMLVRYAIERLLYRLSISSYADRFILKGATLLGIWGDISYRPTRDVDFLTYGRDTAEAIAAVFRNICRIAAADGIVFDPDTIVAEEIRGRDEYGGVTITLSASLEQARIAVKIDIGFGDTVTPAPTLEVLPSLVALESPSVRAYNRETYLAEKLQAIVALGMANSRMKDFFDIQLISRHFEFKGEMLASAIEQTFRRRKTAIPPGIPVPFTSDFYDAPDKKQQWTAFMKRIGRQPHDLPLPLAVEEIRQFIMPVLNSIRHGQGFGSYWPPRGPWQ